MGMERERRSYPRYLMKCPVEVSLPEDNAGAASTTAASSKTSSTTYSTTYHTTSISLSLTSIQIECSAELVAALLRQQRLPCSCQLQFALPWHSQRFNIDAHLVTQRRVSQQQYVLVLILRHADAEQESLLESLLATKQPIGLD